MSGAGRLAVRRIHLADACAGLFLCIASLGGLWAGSDLMIGTARRMGPGFMPALAFGATLILGIAVIVAAISRAPGRDDASDISSMPWRAIGAVSAAMLFLATASPTLGLALSSFTSVLIAAMAERHPRWREVFLLALVLSVAASSVFILALRVRIPLLPVF